MSPQMAASPSPPNSFPNSFRRPLSYQQETSFPPEMHAQVSAAAVARRASVQSPFSQLRPGTQNPPLPHHPQAHFYGAPDIDFDLPTGTGIKAGHSGHYFGFDTLPSPHTELTPGLDNVVVAGYQGGLEVHSITRRGLDRVAALRGLRGAVLEAKILPWVSSGPHAEAYPLIAVVVHGPVLPRATPDIAIQRVNEVNSEGGLDPGSPRPDSSHREPVTGRMSPTIEFYQTTVELYSLKTNRIVDVLLEAPKIGLSTSITSPIFKAPAPTGAFKIKADGGNIVVASGTTGEAWVYKLLEVGTDDGKLHAGCTGKIWTTLQQPLKVDHAEDPGRLGPLPPPRAGPPTPIIALNGRWLAHCPPNPSTQIALRANIPVPLIGRAPGVSSVTSPVLPPVTSTLDIPNNEGLMNKIMRETTQELISSAKWVGQQGMQAWNAYWYKNPAQQPRSPPLQPQQWAGSYPPRQDSPHFPPTHGTPGQAVTTKEPGLVSIVDLGTTGSSVTVHPVSTFSTLLGCSFLSFSPSGMSLFTASSKGDVQTVWDLMRMQYTKSSPVQVSNTNTALGPRVRQVAQFSRMTVARIVDVAWSRPNGERLAMITEKGTVHLLDMPETAFSWPPPRRRRATEANGAPASETPSSAVSIASSAVGAAFQAARPLITRPRRGSATVSPSNGNNFVENASQGGRYIAASISQSLGKTGTAINQLRHTADNRVSLPPSPLLPSASCVVWLTGKRFHTLYVLGDGLVRTFPSKSRHPTKARAQRGGLYKDFKVPLLPGDTLAPAVQRFIDDDCLDLPEHDADVGNTLTLDPRARISQPDLSAEAAIPQAEIESSAPYQPFHTDRRVGLYEYGGAAPAAEVSAMADLLAETSLDERPSGKKKKQRQPAVPVSAARGAWAFGQKLDLVQLDLGYSALPDEDFNTSDDMRALPTSSMERVMHAGDRPDEIVVTTRRRRGRRAAEDEDGFFEDDCEILDFADQRV
ncbi:hypothetical protein F5X68DRAFT_63785 [Plectosphaerella plurivora]|uniref:Uncharacterized protein n=1 Tax=Plectosphaerella plurivora TaxID=936078 RepID=A0A9P8V062_9PEZI|nr:hypothetical protein F5X68DRAFT_63785 [Plectosphaerella plurivora]